MARRGEAMLDGARRGKNSTWPAREPSRSWPARRLCAARASGGGLRPPFGGPFGLQFKWDGTGLTALSPL